MRTQIRFNSGTLEIRNAPSSSLLSPVFAWDARSMCYRAPANAYADMVLRFVHEGLEYEDQARQYSKLANGLRVRQEPRPFQREATDAWRHARGQGVVVLPTGAGKSYVALMAIEEKRRSTLVIAPTLDLVRQWYDLLRTCFALEVGVIGGGEYTLKPLTVTTYDSAYLHMEHIGDKFGMVVFDECHHLPGDAYGLAARFCLAPFRLGLTATPEREDGRHAELAELIGPTIYRRDIVEMTGRYLADYDVKRIIVDLSPEEKEEYKKAREIYRSFVARHGIRMQSPDGWNQFIVQSSRTGEGRQAMEAYQRQRKLAFTAPSKLDYLEHLLYRHRNDCALIFTQDNQTAYAVSQRFLIPVITQRTKVTERSEILSGLADGTYTAIATSKVLNEGVDVPEANVAIILSGSASVREHVQRLGRVLRKKKDGSRAVLYELVASGTSEAFISQRRREHSAYR